MEVSSWGRARVKWEQGPITVLCKDVEQLDSVPWGQHGPGESLG